MTENEKLTSPIGRICEQVVECNREFEQRYRGHAFGPRWPNQMDYMYFLSLYIDREILMARIIQESRPRQKDKTLYELQSDLAEVESKIADRSR